MARMDAGEFLRWQAFDEIDPIGDERLDRLMAMLMEAVINCGGFGRKREDAVRASDLLPDWGRAREQQERAIWKGKAYRLRKAREFVAKHGRKRDGR